MIDGEPRCRLPYLVSYAYLRKQPADQIRTILDDPRREVLLDSGAFTAFNAGKAIEVDDYIEFLRAWKANLFGYFLLDKIQDPVATEANWQAMLVAGLSPIPIHVFGEDGVAMDRFFARSPYVGLGGLRRPSRGKAPIEYVKQKMVWARGRPVHWLGYTDEETLRAFRPFSCDSASAWAASQFGVCHLYRGNGKWWAGEHHDWIRVSGAEARSLRATLVEYGLSLDALDSADSWRWQNANDAERVCDTRAYVRTSCNHDQPTHVAAHLAVRSFVRYAYDIRRIFGTRVFLASTCDTRFDRIVDCALEVAHARGWDQPLGVA